MRVTRNWINVTKSLGVLLFLLLVSLIIYSRRWPSIWRFCRVGTWRKAHEQRQIVLEKLEKDDSLIHEVADVVIQLRVSAERLEEALQTLRKEEEKRLRDGT
jgi:hypothetical protein